MNWSALPRRIRASLFRSRLDDELEEELQFHVAMQARRNLASGMKEPEAERMAHVQFGGLQQVKEECRDARGLRSIETLWQDIRYALRGFRRTPGFALTVVCTIAVGLGLNTTLFTVFNAYALRPLPVRDPYSLYQLSWSTRTGGRFFTPEESQEVQQASPAFSEALSYEPVFTRTGGQPFFGTRVSGNYFSMLGIDAAYGRPLIEADAAPSASSAAVLSYAAWETKLGSDSNIVGRTLRMFGKQYEVVGVARRGFNGVGQVPSDFWIPQTGGNDPRAPAAQTIVGRLRPGLSEKAGIAAMMVQAARMTAAAPPEQRVTAVTLRSNATTLPINPESIALFTPVAAAFLLVLLIACTNVVNMTLARSLARQREIAVRLSIGAPRARLVRQLVTESLTLALPSAIAGFAVSQATIRLAETALLASMPPIFAKLIRLVELAPDGRVFAFLTLASVGATLVFGLIPAMQATHTNLTSAARGESIEGVRSSHLRSGLVIGQVTMCVLLLICAGILLQASRNLSDRDPGLMTRGVSSVQLNQPVQSRIIEQLAAERSVELAATAWRAPLAGVLREISVATDTAAPGIRAGYNFVSPEYFDVLRIPVLRGRNFTASEAKAESAAVIVSEATANLLWPGKDALGRTIHIVRSDSQNDRANKLPGFRTAQVVGIARDVISGLVLDGRDRTCLYFPTDPHGAQNGTLLVRFRDDSGTARRSLDTILERTAPAAVLRVTRMTELFSMQIYPFHVSFAIASFLGALALVLTVSGVYGVLSYLVTQRTKEIGIRMALGATSAAVVRRFLMAALKLALVGIILGVLLCLGVSRMFASQVESLNPFDMIAYISGIFTVLTATVLAAYLPSRRAARIEPVIALRCD